MNNSYKRAIENEPWLTSYCILCGYRGSIAHGMYDNNNLGIDDKDTMAVAILPIDYYFGIGQSQDAKEIKVREWDIVVYELRKFIGLLAKGNPNVLSLLWLRPEHYIYKSSLGQLLIDNRELFVGKHIYNSFVGYAHGQIHKMTHLAFEGYMGQKRKELVDKFGYDCKNAAHCIRLLRMCIEFLGNGELQVMRYDNNELLAIKRGEWSLEKVKEEAEMLFAEARHAYSISKLPETSDLNGINRLCTAILSNYFFSLAKEDVRNE